jgi:hypothetical protein
MVTALPAPIVVAPPENLQLQSPLIRLPAEIKHIIYSLCFVTEHPITDLKADRTCGQKNTTAYSKLGINLLQTCRRTYYEADRRPLFACNTFRFTTADAMRQFFHSLPASHRMCIQDVEIDVRRVHSDHPDLAHEWLDYLAPGPLRKDAGGLRCLRLNFEAWPIIPMCRAELWNLLRNMLSKLEDLDRIVVLGTSQGGGMHREPPWSPIHFVGGDDVGQNDLLIRMSEAVAGNSGDDKIISWVREDKRLQLEVTSRRYHTEMRRYGSPERDKHTGPWLLNGSCSISEYNNLHFRIEGS